MPAARQSLVPGGWVLAFTPLLLIALMTMTSSIVRSSDLTLDERIAGLVGGGVASGAQHLVAERLTKLLCLVANVCWRAAVNDYDRDVCRRFLTDALDRGDRHRKPVAGNHHNSYKV